jgi:hypothetical protein
MLALRRLSSVDTPTSECSTSWTRCCVCVSCDARRGSGETGAAGAAGSIGEDSGPSSEGAGAALKSGLKLSALSMGDMAGGAAIAGAVVVVAVVICAPSAVEVRARVLGCSFRAGCRARDAPSSQPHL